MPLLIALFVILAGFALLGMIGLASEREPGVAAVRARLDRLTHSERGRLGVWIAKDDRFSWAVRPLPLTAFVYWVTPIDFIPDGIPRIGYLDDRVVLALSLRLTLQGRGRRLFEEHLGRAEYLHEVNAARDLEEPATEGDEPPL